jgi:hypothetical protein
MTKTDVLRAIADTMDDGAPTPLSMTVYADPVSVLVESRADWATWIAWFDGSVTDGIRHDRYPGKHRPHWEWTNGEVVFTYLEDEVTKVGDEAV